MDDLETIKKKLKDENQSEDFSEYTRKRYYPSFLNIGLSLAHKVSSSGMMKSSSLKNMEGENLHPYMEKFSSLSRKARIQNLKEVAKSKDWFTLSKKSSFSIRTLLKKTPTIPKTKKPTLKKKKPAIPKKKATTKKEQSFIKVNCIFASTFFGF